MILTLLLAAATGPAELAIRVETPHDERRHRVSAVGLAPELRAWLAEAGPAELTRALAVYVGGHAPARDVPSIAGTHAVDEDGLHFLPRFPFVSGVRYFARLAVGGAEREHNFEVAPPAGREPPRVLAVHPSGDTLPQNTLRLYVQFSQPMAARGVHRHMRLLGPDGEVPLAFVEVEDGLWDPQQTRLTLFFHPGRVKRGVALGQRLGPPLQRGNRYRLVVDAALTDTAGVALGRRFEHSFAVVGTDRTPPLASDVRVEPPASPHDALVVTLPEPLDHGMLQRWLWVESDEGNRLAGHVQVAGGETQWKFEPEAPWAAGRYTLRFPTALEDRAGNRFDRLFDREAEVTAPSGQASVLSIAFVVPGPRP